MKTIYLSLFLSLLLSTSVQAGQNMRCIVFDIGEGQAILLQKDETGILIDTGNFATSHEVVRLIRKYGVKDLDFIILTHLHPDHASGIFTLKEYFPETVIYESGYRIPFEPQNNAYRWTAEGVDSKRWNVKKILQGDFIEWHGVKLDILWPKPSATGSLNSQSLIVHVTDDDASILIMGDAYNLAETTLLQEEKLPKDVDVLVVGHHGAIDTTQQSFVDWVQPQHAVISVNENNIYDHPENAVVERLQRSGAQIHMTYNSGDFIWPIVDDNSGIKP